MINKLLFMCTILGGLGVGKAMERVRETSSQELESFDYYIPIRDKGKDIPTCIEEEGEPSEITPRYEWAIIYGKIHDVIKMTDRSPQKTNEIKKHYTDLLNILKGNQRYKYLKDMPIDSGRVYGKKLFLTRLLCLATGQGETEVVQFLCKIHTPNCYNNAGWTPLHLAVNNNDFYMVQVLLQNATILVNAPKNCKDSIEDITPYTIAYIRGYVRIAQLLKKHGGKRSTCSVKNYMYELFDALCG